MLTKPHEILRAAARGNFGIGAFNTSNLEVTQAIVKAAESQKAPVIVQTSEGALEYAGLEVLAGVVKTLAAESAVPVVLHLDHGKSLDVIKQCIEAGFTSVMIDASSEDLAENIAITSEVVRYAHERDVWVEAELGAMPGVEGLKEAEEKNKLDELLTDPEQAKKFVQETGVDALAVAIGTIHGAFTGQEYIRFELLGAIEKAVPDLPLVLHGASGVAARQLKRAVTTSVCKVNVDTEMRMVFAAAVKSYFNEAHDKIDIREILAPAREAVQRAVAEKIKIFGSAGRVKM